MGTTCSTLFYVENLHHEEKGGYETNGAHIEYPLLIWCTMMLIANELLFLTLLRSESFNGNGYISINTV